MDTKNQRSIAILNQAAAINFTNGDPIFFNMMNYNTNGFATVQAYLRFYRFSSMYLEIDPLAT
jgi:hypothetical protein